jgi:PII-like signaling protein
MIQAPAKLLVIFIDETDTWNNTPLYEAIVRRLRQLNVAGATVHIGVMGYGSHGTVHHKHLFGVSDDRPVTISVVENAEKLRSILPEIRPMVREGLIMLSDVEVVEIPPLI